MIYGNCYNTHVNNENKITITSAWLNYSWLHSLSPPDYEQEPQLNEMVHSVFGQPSRLPLAAQFIKKRCELSFDVEPGGLSAAATII